MDKDLILKQEAENDGKSVYLYFDAMTGMYLAFGLSAYYATLVAEPYVSYSTEMQLPVVLLRRFHIQQLRQSMKMVEHTTKKYYQFEMKQTLGDAGYEKWASKIIAKTMK